MKPTTTHEFGASPITKAKRKTIAMTASMPIQTKHFCHTWNK
jgi:hypothetical protein